MVNKNEEKNSGVSATAIGSTVIVRTIYAGVFFGTLAAREGDEVVLDGARRIWRWFGANTCTDLAKEGLDITKSKIAGPLDGHRIKGWIEILPCTEIAASKFEAAKWAK